MRLRPFTHLLRHALGWRLLDAYEYYSSLPISLRGSAKYGHAEYKPAYYTAITI
jgi:hypothetical protein